MRIKKMRTTMMMMMKKKKQDEKLWRIKTTDFNFPLLSPRPMVSVILVDVVTSIIKINL